MASQTVCFTCGQPIGEPPRINELPDGEPCPTCRDRLLDSLPALLPSWAPALVAEDDGDEDADEPRPHRQPFEEGWDPPAGA